MLIIININALYVDYTSCYLQLLFFLDIYVHAFMMRNKGHTYNIRLENVKKQFKLW